MTHAYSELYLDDAMRNMGEMVDYAVNACGIDMDLFWDMFLAGGFASQFEAGVPNVVSGRSGTELAQAVLEKSGMMSEFPKPQEEYQLSAQYWCGWALAYYQWYTGRSFRNIRNYISLRELERLYPALHEASEQRFVEAVNGMIRRKELPTALQSLRKNCGYSQRELAEHSGVNIRNIQQYEQRKKNINKAAGVTLAALSRALGCRMEDLMEYDGGGVGGDDLASSGKL